MEVKKTQSKAFANLIASILLLCFEGWAWYQTTLIKTAKNAAVQPSAFPRLVSMKANDPLAAKAESLNFIKDKGVLAALFVIVLCAVYTYFFKSAGYVIVSFLLSAIIMWLIGLRKPVPLLLISALVPLGMWLVFYKFLAVNIPMGWLQFLRDLVDKI